MDTADTNPPDLNLVYYKNKTTAQKHLKEGCILANRSFTKYFILENYTSFLDTILHSPQRDFYEYIPSNIPVNFFLDIEIYKDQSEYFAEPENLLQTVFDDFVSYFKDYVVKKIVLESHSDTKKSFHVIFRLEKEDSLYCFESVKACKRLYKLLHFDKYKDKHNKYIVDPSVYREGLFRTIYSSKTGESRPLVYSDILTDNSTNVTNVTTDIDSFVCYIPPDKLPVKFIDIKNTTVYKPITRENTNEGEVESGDEREHEISTNDKASIINYIETHYHHLPNKIRDIIIDLEYNCIVIALFERYCFNVKREHRSNNQYIVIDNVSCKQKCHDTECNDYKHHEIGCNVYPYDIQQLVKRYLKSDQKEDDLIETATLDCKTYITENFDSHVDDLSFDSKEMIFRGGVSEKSMIQMIGRCPECKMEHQITPSGYCVKCIVCKSMFPKTQLIPVDERYQNLNNFWMNYTQLTNHGTINNIINIYQNSQEDFSCDIKLDKSIIREKKILTILNECLDGHKVTKMAELMHHLYKDYVYTGNEWFYFNGQRWVTDVKSLNYKKDILQLCKLFDKIRKHYETKRSDESSMTLIKNIKSLNTKLNKPQLKDDILKESQLFYMDQQFFTKLNSKKHLVPFENGVVDLLTTSFRSSKKEDYTNLSVNYTYDQDINNPEVHQFINSILPNRGVRDFVLKKMSECLNGDIPNTNFLMFIGDGANGKSQLLNLMKLTMGDFGEKVEVTLLTRKRNNANEANTEKIKLMNKRFAFLSEPEDGEKINIGLLKELTGSEEIVARGLYQESMSFVMEAKLFLACNELPEIKGEDTALWRRIRVIDFPSRFVDEPKEANEYPIDRTLPSRMREDISWRQTFMNILLSYYHKTVSEPEEVKLKTNEYRQENNEFWTWLDENIEYKEDSVLNLKDICETYLGKSVPSRISSKYKKEIEKWIKSKYSIISEKYRDSTFNGEKVKGWIGIAFRE